MLELEASAARPWRLHDPGDFWFPAVRARDDASVCVCGYETAGDDGRPEHRVPLMLNLIVEGKVLEADPPNTLVQTWHLVWDPEIVAEAIARLTWEIEEGEGEAAKLILVSASN